MVARLVQIKSRSHVEPLNLNANSRVVDWAGVPETPTAGTDGVLLLPSAWA